MIEIYVGVTTLHQDLLTICTQRHISPCELQRWRQKFRCLENILRSVNLYLGGSVLILFVMGVSTLIPAIFHIISRGSFNLILPTCNIIVIMAALTLPSAILNGKVGMKYLNSETEMYICSVVGCIYLRIVEWMKTDNLIQVNQDMKYNMVYAIVCRYKTFSFKYINNCYVKI